MNKPAWQITISDNFLIYGEKTISMQERGKLNPKFLLALNDTVKGDDGNSTTTLWYLTVTSTESGKWWRIVSSQLSISILFFRVCP